MIKIKKIVLIPIFFLFSILCFSSVYSATTYPNVGYNEYYGGLGYWYYLLIDETIRGKSIDNGFGMPIVCDSNNDGTEEIYITAEGELNIYTGTSLTVVDGLTIGGVTDTFSPILCKDIDGDSTKELMIYNQVNENISILSFNGSNLITEANFNIPIQGGTLWVGTALQCNDEYCLLFASQNAGDSSESKLISFDKTGIVDTDTVISAIDVNYILPQNDYMTLDDIDYDGDNEFVTGGFLLDTYSTDNEGIWLLVASLNSSGHIYERLLTQYITNWGIGDGFSEIIDYNAVYTDYNLKLATTGILPVESDGKSSNGKEIWIGFMTKANKVKLLKIKGSTLEIADDFPELSDLDGDALTNLVRADVFGDGEGVDVCMGIVTDATEEFKIYCASDQATLGQGGQLFDVTTDYKLSKNADVFNYLIHSVETSPNTHPDNLRNPDEILTTYGIFQLNGDGSIEDDCTNEIWYQNCDSDEVYGISQRDMAVIPIDYENINHFDMIALKNTTILYFDDGYTNYACGTDQNCITDLEVCPHHGYIWKQNTTVTVTIQGTDYEGDNLQWKSQLYALSDNQETGWRNITSGDYDSALFFANKSTNFDQLIISIRDFENLDTNESYIFSFSVANEGLEYDEQLCYSLSQDNVVDEDEDGVADGLVSDDEDAITSTITTFTEHSGLSKAVIWLLIMIVVGVAIVIYTSKGGETMLGIIIAAFIEFLLVIVGTILGYLPVAYLISIIVIGIILSGIAISKVITQSNGGS